MSREDVEAAREWAEDWLALGNLFAVRDIDPGSDARSLPDEDVAAFVAPLLCDDVEYTEDPLWPGADTFRGSAAVAKRFTEYTELWGLGSRLTLDDVVDAGERVVVCLRLRYEGLASGATVEQPFFWLMTMRDGRAAMFTMYLDRAKALRAAGLEPGA